MSTSEHLSDKQFTQPCADCHSAAMDGATENWRDSNGGRWPDAPNERAAVERDAAYAVEQGYAGCDKHPAY